MRKLKLWWSRQRVLPIALGVALGYVLLAVLYVGVLYVV
jgi:hypothetical protein